MWIIKVTLIFSNTLLEKVKNQGYRSNMSNEQHRGFINLFKVDWFSQLSKTIWTELLYKKNFALDVQARQANSSSQLVDLPSA